MSEWAGTVARTDLYTNMWVPPTSGTDLKASTHGSSAQASAFLPSLGTRACHPSGGTWYPRASTSSCTSAPGRRATPKAGQLATPVNTPSPHPPLSSCPHPFRASPGGLRVQAGAHSLCSFGLCRPREASAAPTELGRQQGVQGRCGHPGARAFTEQSGGIATAQGPQQHRGP